MSSNRSIATLVLVCLVTLALGGCGGSSPTVVTVSAPSAGAAPPALTGLQQSFVTVIARVAPMVVQISTPQGLGSGVVFDTSGDMVTNAHVVAGGAPLQVTDSRGHTYPATLVGTFAPDDLAVVRAQRRPPAKRHLCRLGRVAGWRHRARDR